MDLSIPVNLPSFLREHLKELVQDYQEGNLTIKGYTKKRLQLLEKYATSNTPSKIDSPLHSREHSLVSSVRTQNNVGYSHNDIQSITSSRLSQVTGSSTSYKLTTTHSNSIMNTSYAMNSTLLNDCISSCTSDMTIPQDSKSVKYNPMIPLLPRFISNDQLNSVQSILKSRSQFYEKEVALMSINSYGKETLISWKKLYSKAEKVAYELNNRNLSKSEKIILWYNIDDVIEFMVALLGCFISGIIAIPVSFETYLLNEIIEIIKLTGSRSILISDECLKQLDNLYVSDNSKLKLLKSDFFMKINFLKTDDLGSYSRPKKLHVTYDVNKIAYIEFTKTPLGRLSGVVIKHDVLSKQLENALNILNSLRKSNWKKNDIMKSYNDKSSSPRYIIVNSLDPTRSTGLILGVLFTIFSGNLLITIHPQLLKAPGAYENIINKYRADILLSDQLQLKQVVINYLENPSTAISKRTKIDFSCIKCCLASCTTIDTEVSDMIVHKWLKNFGCMNASQCYSPILTLLDFGGVFISLQDQLGRVESFPLHDSKLRLQHEIFIERKSLKINLVKTSVPGMINSSSSTTDYLKLSSFGFPIPDATLCVVNPDDQTLVNDLTVGEIWLSSPSIPDTFYQMDKISNFVFKAKLNYKKMINYCEITSTVNSDNTVEDNTKRLHWIFSLISCNMTFTRTKLMGFVHNGKVYILSLIEDMFLQNKLIRLPNWSHTSNITKLTEQNYNESDQNSILKSNRIVETNYLQHITENIVRTVDKVSEVAAFKLPHNSNEHFLVMVVESFLANSPSLSSTLPSRTTTYTVDQNLQFEKRMNQLTEQIYKILWIFHKIQPFCILVVPLETLPRRYCSLEIANSTVERKFLSGDLKSKFVKFQLDNVILDFIPHSGYHNESIFSEHLSNLRHAAVRSINNEDIDSVYTSDFNYQNSGLNCKIESIDDKTGKNLTDFRSIIDLLEWRVASFPNCIAFYNCTTLSSNSSSNTDIYKNVSWQVFDSIVASFLKKIIDSKNPLRSGDHVIIISDNSVEYVAMVIACFYCNFVVIPIQILQESYAKEEMSFLINVINSYDVKRIFVDFKTNNLFEQSSTIGTLIKKLKHLIPKITVFSKIKKKFNISTTQLKDILKQKFQFNSNTVTNDQLCLVWIDRHRDIDLNINTAINHSTLLKLCKILKQTLQLTSEDHIFSLCSHTIGLGFLQSCVLGIYVGSITSMFSSSEITVHPKEFLDGLQNLNVKHLYLTAELLYIVMDRASNIIKSVQLDVKKNVKSSFLVLRPNFLKNVQNIMIPFNGRPRWQIIQNLIKRYPIIELQLHQINYLYQHRFNSLVTLPFHLGVPPNSLYLDSVLLREGIVKEIDPSTVAKELHTNFTYIQDSGSASVSTNIAIVNPETLEPCYENEIGEIWYSSEATVPDYYICDLGTPVDIDKGSNNHTTKKLSKDSFISHQFNSSISGTNDKYKYLRSGDFGFIKNIKKLDNQGNLLNLSVLYVLGSINETVEILGLTHFVNDLEASVKTTHKCISNCIVIKAGGLLSCLVECVPGDTPEYSNLVPLIVSQLLKNHGIILDLCCFIKPGSLNLPNTDWTRYRQKIMSAWLTKEIEIVARYGINFGENNSIYLLSDFER